MKNLKFFFFLALSMSMFVSLQACTSSDSVNTKDTIDKGDSQHSSTPPTSQPSPQPTFDAAKADKLTNTAKFLAGIPVDNNSPLASSQNKASRLNHRRFFDNAWSKLEDQQITKVKQWSQQELQAVNSDSISVFYPFSGPDFLYAYSFFPNSKEYLLVGLEPVGNVPDMASLSESQRDWKLEEVRSSLYAILQYSFFRTNDMKVDLQKIGVLPVLYVFLARTENRIVDVQQVGIDKDANIKPFEKGMISGVKIGFIPKGETQPRTLYYFSTDLSNDGIKKRPELSQFITKFDNKVTYLKAASYLMYYENFSEIKNVILTQSSHLLQDDSGIPLRAFNRSEWDLKFYGAYSSPIGLFANRYQPDLRKIYVSDNNIKPLNFGIGYKFRPNESNLMLGVSAQRSALKR
jgi:hypothetical protein